MRKNRFVIASALLIHLFLPFYAQQNDMGRTAYNDALFCFGSRDYGRALRYAETAVSERRNSVEAQLELLENATASEPVQRAGDSIDSILLVLDRRGESNAADIIRFYVRKKGEDCFGGSMKSMLSYIGGTAEYPEAQKLIGDVYRMEGEYSFAEDWYLEALKNAGALDIPDAKYEILYQLAEISRLKGDPGMMEKRLLNIAASDPHFTDGTFMDSMCATVKGRRDPVGKFFVMYRAGSFYAMNAYSELAEYYSGRGEYDRALRACGLAVITGFTKVCSVVESRDTEFSYSDLRSFFAEVGRYSDIKQWGTDNSLWKSFNMLAEISGKCGGRVFSSGLYDILADASPDPYWRGEASVSSGRNQ